MSTPAYAVRDSRTMLRRNLRHMWRYPTLTLMVAGIPVVLLLLFVQMVGTITPLFLFPAETFTTFPLAPTLEVLIAMRGFTGIALGGIQAVAMALYARKETGRGRYIDASLMQGGAEPVGLRLGAARARRHRAADRCAATAGARRRTGQHGSRAWW